MKKLDLNSTEWDRSPCRPGPRLTLKGLSEVLLPNGLKGAVNEKALSVYRISNSAIFIPAPHLYPKEPADEILSGKIMGQRVGMPIDWSSNPLGSLEWTHFLHRHHFLRSLVLAAAKNGDARYFEALENIIAGWIADNPVPVDSNGGAGPSWETLSVGWRLREWLWVAGALIPTSEITAELSSCKAASQPSENYVCFSQLVFPSGEDKLRDAHKVFGEGCGEDLFTKRSSPQSSALFLCSIWEHARSLMDHQGHPNNWIIVESAALALAGLCFPGFRESGEWLETGIQRLEREFRRQFFSDGVHFEVSPLYHAICFHAFLEVKEVAEAAGTKLPKVFRGPLERCADYLEALCRPNFTWPSLNDSGSADMDYTVLLFKAGEIFGRPDLKWIGSKGAEGMQPEPCVRIFADAGIAAMPSGHRSDSNLLVFRAGPPGAAHVHDDILSLDLTALGVPRLVDPGITTYGPSLLTDHYRSAKAHNTILIDGRGPNRSSMSFSERIQPARREFSYQADHEFLCCYGNFSVAFR